MTAIEFSAGVALVLLVLSDIFRTILLPRPTHRALRLAPLLDRTLSPAWRWGASRIGIPRARQTFRASLGPLLMLLSILIWAGTIPVSVGRRAPDVSVEIGGPVCGPPDGAEFTEGDFRLVYPGIFGLSSNGYITATRTGEVAAMARIPTGTMPSKFIPGWPKEFSDHDRTSFSTPMTEEAARWWTNKIAHNSGFYPQSLGDALYDGIQGEPKYNYRTRQIPAR